MQSSCFLSVIIPTYNRARRLPILLDALFSQDMDHQRSEIIIIDDGSQDSTWALLQATQQSHKDGWLRVLTQSNQGQAAARQYGVREARGNILLFLDDDMEAANGHFLQAHLRFHEQSVFPTVALGAILPPRNNPTRPAFELFYEKSLRNMYEAFQQSRTAPAGVHFFSANVSLPRELFQKAGGFNPEFRQAEDRELGLRLQHKAQAQFVFLAEAAAYHNSQTGKFQGFLQRARLYGHYDLQIALMYPAQASLHPRLMLKSSHPMKRLLARLIWKWPTLAHPLTWILIPFAKLMPRTWAVAICSMLYCIQYVLGYHQSPLRSLDPTQHKESDHDAA